MENLFVALIVIGVIAVIAAAIAGFVIYEKKRTEKYQQWAQELGLAFSKSGDSQMLQRLQRFPFFNQGSSRKMRNTIVGETDEVRMATFDYQYTVGGGKNSHTHRQTVVTMESGKLRLPPFQMRPETLFDRIGGAFGMQDIDFDTHPEFSAAFLLRSSQEAQVREFFDDRVLKHFEGMRGVCVEAADDSFFICRPSKRVSVEDARSLLQLAYGTYSVLAERSESWMAQHPA